MKKGYFIVMLLCSLLISSNAFAADPIANAGPDDTANEGGLVTLDGTASSDPDSDPITYSWAETTAIGVTLSDATIAKPSFIAPSVTGDTPVTFELTVDDGGTTHADSVTITVSNVNQDPVADAGSNQTVYEGDSVTLDGTNSSDPDGSVDVYAWNQIGTPAVTLTGAGTHTATFDAPFAGDVTLTFQLQVTDNDTTTNSDTMTVTVMPNKWDVNQDNQVGLEDAIYALQTTSNLRDTAPSTCTSADLALVGATGQRSCWDADGDSVSCSGTGYDGDLEAGVAWPNPRFTDMGDGTVKDNLTNLIWLQNPNCLGRILWQAAVDTVNSLQDGTCSLADGSAAGDWRLPNIKELLSLLDYQYDFPAISNDAGTSQWRNDSSSSFGGFHPSPYWSSTTNRGKLSEAFVLGLMDGEILHYSKFGSSGVTWAVKNE